MGSKSGGNPKREVTDYFLTIHYGVCYTPDAVKEVFYGEKSIFQAANRLLGDTVEIDDTELFGGPKKEGGAKGDLRMFYGESNQIFPQNLKVRMGGVSLTPDYRGILSVVFEKGGVGANPGGSTNDTGFYWGSNSGFIRDTWFRVFRRPKGVSSQYINIERAKPGGGFEDDVNPAFIIYECLTDTDWGLGAPLREIDRESFDVAAKTLFDERFGLSLMWSSQNTIEDFINDILETIDGTLIPNPRTGRLRLRLNRMDYNADDLPVLDPNSCTVTNFGRRAWGETSNEVVVSYTDPANEEDVTVSYQDLGNIAQQGRIRSETKNYPGVRSSELAMRLAQRDCNRAAAPLASVEVVCDRTPAGWVPGDLFVLNWPKLGINRMVFRIGTMNYGRPGESGVKITAVEDIFDLGRNAYASPPDTEWQAPDAPAKPLEDSLLTGLPYYFVARELGDEQASQMDPDEVMPFLLAGEDTNYAYGFDYYENDFDAAGGAGWVKLRAMRTTLRGTLTEVLPKQMVSDVAASIFQINSAYPTVGSIFYFTGPEGDELALVTASDRVAERVTLRRGILDTVPRSHPSGTSLWLLPATGYPWIAANRLAGSNIQYRLATKNPSGRLKLEDAPVDAGRVTDRQNLPYRPANVRIWDTVWPEVVAGYAPETEVSWSPRNRLLETTQILPWGTEGTPAEEGTTYTLRLYDGTRQDPLVSETKGITGNSATVDLTLLTGAKGTLTVHAERDGLESYQADEHTFTVAGYGMNYGNYYGGFGG